MSQYPECKYCDNPMPPARIGDEVVCSRCGAEWADAMIMVEHDESELEDFEEWEDTQ